MLAIVVLLFSESLVLEYVTLLPLQPSWSSFVVVVFCPISVPITSSMVLSKMQLSSIYTFCLCSLLVLPWFEQHLPGNNIFFIIYDIIILLILCRCGNLFNTCFIYANTLLCMHIAFQATLIVMSLCMVSCTHLSPGMKLTKCSKSSACSWCGMKTMSSHMCLSHMDITLSISLRALADGKRFQTCIMIISKGYSNGVYHYVDCIGEIHDE